MSKPLKLVESMYPLTLELLLFTVFSPLRLEEGEKKRKKQTEHLLAAVPASYYASSECLEAVLAQHETTYETLTLRTRQKRGKRCRGSEEGMGEACGTGMDGMKIKTRQWKVC